MVRRVAGNVADAHQRAEAAGSSDRLYGGRKFAHGVAVRFVWTRGKHRICITVSKPDYHFMIQLILIARLSFRFTECGVY